MNNQEDRNCRGDRKPWYTIAEAAARWCNIQGRTIQLDEQNIPYDDPKNPCLRPRAQEILFATDEGVLSCGRDGKSVVPGEHVARPRRTILHSDLKKWMIDNFPGDRPAFLFDEVERNIHPGVDVKAYSELKARYEARNSQFEEAKKKIPELEERIRQIEIERDGLQKSFDILKKNNGEIGQRRKNTLLIVIASLCDIAKINPYDWGVSQIIMEASERIGARVSDDTIRNIMNETQQALESKRI